jgi:hypothetical protein
LVILNKHRTQCNRDDVKRGTVDTGFGDTLRAAGLFWLAAEERR